MKEKPTCTIDELKEAITQALANWDFSACSHYGAEQKRALELALAHPSVLCDVDEDGFYYEISGKDIWDSLSMYAEATAANLAAARIQ